MVFENTINSLKEKYGGYRKNVAATGSGKGLKKMTLIAWIIIMPYILWNIVFWLYPNIVSIPIALFETSLISAKAVFVGLDNFLDFFKREEFRMIMYNMIRFGIIYIPLSLVISMMLALMLNSVKNVALKSFLVISYFLPNLTAGVAYSVIFQKIFDPHSFLTKAISTITGTNIGWFSDTNIVLIPMAIMIVWKSSGYYALLLLANISSIPDSYHEAALIDGAGSFTRFWKITLPMINPTFVIVVIFAVTTFFGMFAEPLMLTEGGGPMLASYTFKMEIFHQIYDRMAVGYGAAVSLVAGIMSYVLVLLIKKFVGKEV
ncbi:MAG: sugar ABC transporter permease [Spirochaetales bacterium]|nr:sugar ABC transporter permease [Spirochaetales bacterium]